MKISTYFLLGALVLCFCSLDAQTDPWLALPSTDNFPGADRRIVPNKYVSYRADTTVLKDLLWAAPHERNVSAPQSELEIQLPNPDGEIESFHIVAYDMMEPALQEAWWYIRTWRGVSSTNPRVTIRLDWTDRGFHAMVRGGEGGSWFIDPLYWDHRDVYQAYYKNDYPAPERPFECHTEHGDIKPGFRPVNPGRAGDCQLRQYRTAVATTGEYTAFHGGTVAGAASAIATTMNRVNGVYEEDLALRCILIANNNSIIYLNPATDPYSNGDGVAMLGENQTNLDNVIGTANYDIGHVFSTGGGGVASLRSPCNSARKARGVTGQGSPVGDPFDIDYVAHEMGHQFGGNHTQNNSCQRSSASMEPGSASSIMGYAGICNPNVQSNSDDYFHGVNIQEIANYMETGGGNSCATIIDMSNGEPTVMMGDDYDIPGGTPFVLSADASDPNGDPLTYCWEQYDNEVGEDMPPLATNTQGPLFRTFDPTSSPERYFPRLSDLVNNIDPTWETLPETNRDMEFRVTIRDFDGTYGCTTEDNIILSVDASAGPFLVTEPNTNVTWFEGSQATVTWDVAGTNSAPISCSDVDILLSYDGGFTYPVVLQGGTANDGSENITVPNGTSSTARVMVRCSDNVFFDISNVNFDIDPASAPDFTITYNDGAVQACEGTNGSLDFVVNTASIAGFNDPITLSTISSPLGVNVAFSANPVNPGDAVTVTVSNFSSLAAGSYMVTVEGSSTSGDKTVDLPFVLIDAAGASALISPFDGEIDVDIFPTLDWDPGANADSYFIEVSDAISFSNIIASGTVSDTEFTINAPLSAETVYYWRVQSINTECGAGNTSVVNSFETAPCYYYTFSGNVPISTGAPADYTSTINIPNDGDINDIDVINLDITHTWVGDLRVQLQSPGGTTRTLFTYDCGDSDDVLLSFDDEAPSAVGCPRNTGDKVSPEETLAAFDGQSFGGTWTLLIRDNANQDGGSLNAWNLKICTDNFVIVPVEWVSFTASANGQQAQLLWQTANEENNAGFDIERRAEYETTFQPIGWVDATTFARDINNYSYDDKGLKPGTTYYYRLRQVDYGGDFAYSEIRSVKIEGQEPQWDFYPNPTSDQVQLRLWNVTEDATVTVVNTRGQQVQQLSGLSTGTQVLDLSTQPNGVYWIQLKTGPWSYTERIVKL